MGRGLQGKDPWDGNVRYASDYFDLLSDCAIHLIKKASVATQPSAAEGRRVEASVAAQPSGLERSRPAQWCRG